jgi:hypothetical protein
MDRVYTHRLETRAGRDGRGEEGYTRDIMLPAQQMKGNVNLTGRRQQGHRWRPRSLPPPLPLPLPPTLTHPCPGQSLAWSTLDAGSAASAGPRPHGWHPLGRCACRYPEQACRQSLTRDQPNQTAHQGCSALLRMHARPLTNKQNNKYHKARTDGSPPSTWLAPGRQGSPHHSPGGAVPPAPDSSSGFSAVRSRAGVRHRVWGGGEEERGVITRDELEKDPAGGLGPHEP